MIVRVLRRYAVSVALALDRLLNAVVGGSDRDTVTARAARARSCGRWWGWALCAILDRLDPGHCAREAARCKPPNDFVNGQKVP